MPIEPRTVLKESSGAELLPAERTTLRITGQLVDETGAAIPLGGLTTLTLTLYNRDSSAQETINGVTGTDIKNDGTRGVVDANGNLTLTLLPADNQIVDAAKVIEYHVAQIQWTYGGGGLKAGKYEIEYGLRNLAKVT